MILALLGFNGLESNGYKYPYWSTIIGVILSSSTLYGVVLYAVYYIVRFIIYEKQVIITIKEYNVIFIICFSKKVVKN